MGENSLQECMTTKLVLQKVLEGIICTEKDTHALRGIKKRIHNSRTLICKRGPWKQPSLNQQKKAIYTHLSSILIATGLIQRHRLINCIRKQDPYLVAYKKHISPSNIDPALAKQMRPENMQASLFKYLTKQTSSQKR